MVVKKAHSDTKRNKPDIASLSIVIVIALVAFVAAFSVSSMLHSPDASLASIWQDTLQRAASGKSLQTPGTGADGAVNDPTQNAVPSKNVHGNVIGINIRTFCGDDICNGRENPTTCPEDCGTECGDGTCNGDETIGSCPADCTPIGCIPDGTCKFDIPPVNFCGPFIGKDSCGNSDNNCQTVIICARGSTCDSNTNTCVVIPLPVNAYRYESYDEITRTVSFTDVNTLSTISAVVANIFVVSDIPPVRAGRAEMVIEGKTHSLLVLNVDIKNNKLAIDTNRDGTFDKELNVGESVSFSESTCIPDGTCNYDIPPVNFCGPFIGKDSCGNSDNNCQTVVTCTPGTTCQTSTSTCVPSVDTCIDSDGKNYTNKGFVTDGNAQPTYDVCYTDTGTTPIIGDCEGANCKVSEHYCESPSSQYGSVEGYLCPSGVCKDGACIDKPLATHRYEQYDEISKTIEFSDVNTGALISSTVSSVTGLGGLITKGHTYQLQVLDTNKRDSEIKIDANGDGLLEKDLNVKDYVFLSTQRVCNNNGTCDAGENEMNCPNDCKSPCYDSDGGIVTTEVGTTTGLMHSNPDFVGTRTDTCCGVGGMICNPAYSSNAVVEYYCKDNYLETTIIECKDEGKVCKDGACVVDTKIPYIFTFPDSGATEDVLLIQDLTFTFKNYSDIQAVGYDTKLFSDLNNMDISNTLVIAAHNNEVLLIVGTTANTNKEMTAHAIKTYLETYSISGKTIHVIVKASNEVDKNNLLQYFSQPTTCTVDGICDRTIGEEEIGCPVDCVNPIAIKDILRENELKVEYVGGMDYEVRNSLTGTDSKERQVAMYTINGEIIGPGAVDEKLFTSDITIVTNLINPTDGIATFTIINGGGNCGNNICDVYEAQNNCPRDCFDATTQFNDWMKIGDNRTYISYSKTFEIILLDIKATSPDKYAVTYSVNGEMAKTTTQNPTFGLSDGANITTKFTVLGVNNATVNFAFQVSASGMTGVYQAYDVTNKAIIFNMDDGSVHNAYLDPITRKGALTIAGHNYPFQKTTDTSDAVNTEISIDTNGDNVIDKSIIVSNSVTFTTTNSAVCGNSIIEAPETCDGNTKLCSELDATLSGTAQCTLSCNGWDLSTCQSNNVPILAITSPENYKKYSSSDVKLSFTCSDNELSNVGYILDDRKMDSPTGGATYKIYSETLLNADGSALADGKHTLTAYCNDTSNNLGSIQVNFTVDTSGLLTTCDDSIDGGRNYYTKGTTVTKVLGIPTSTDEDSCSSNTLTEWYCENNDKKSETIGCTYSCQNGACNFCGDNYCDIANKETVGSCPQDCAVSQALKITVNSPVKDVTYQKTIFIDAICTDELNLNRLYITIDNDFENTKEIFWGDTLHTFKYANLKNELSTGEHFLNVSCRNERMQTINLITPFKVEQPIATCNNDGVCSNDETITSCPQDCANYKKVMAKLGVGETNTYEVMTQKITLKLLSMDSNSVQIYDGTREQTFELNGDYLAVLNDDGALKFAKLKEITSDNKAIISVEHTWCGTGQRICNGFDGENEITCPEDCTNLGSSEQCVDYTGGSKYTMGNLAAKFVDSQGVERYFQGMNNCIGSNTIEVKTCNNNQYVKKIYDCPLGCGKTGCISPEDNTPPIAIINKPQGTINSNLVQIDISCNDETDNGAKTNQYSILKKEGTSWVDYGGFEIYYDGSGFRTTQIFENGEYRIATPCFDTKNMAWGSSTFKVDGSTQLTCADSDGGPNVVGTVTISNNEQTLLSVKDSCNYENRDVHYYCGSPTGSSTVPSMFVKTVIAEPGGWSCWGNCEKGICNSITQQPSAVEIQYRQDMESKNKISILPVPEYLLQ